MSRGSSTHATITSNKRKYGNTNDESGHQIETLIEGRGGSNRSSLFSGPSQVIQLESNNLNNMFYPTSLSYEDQYQQQLEKHDELKRLEVLASKGLHPHIHGSYEGSFEFISPSISDSYNHSNFNSSSNDPFSSFFGGRHYDKLFSHSHPYSQSVSHFQGNLRGT
jgi:hypothetical protein